MFVVALLALAGCVRPPSTASQLPPTKLVLRSTVAAAAPQIDGQLSDPAWKRAPALTVKTSTKVPLTMKCVTDSGDIFISLSWPDQTNDAVDEVWQYDGTNWTQGPIDDAVALFWNIDNSVAGFNTGGCNAVCHDTGVGRAMLIKGPYSSKKRWAGANQRGDIWDMSLGISNVRGAGNDYYFGVDQAYLKNPTTLAPVIQRRHDAFTNKAPLELNIITDPDTGQTKPRYRLKDGLTVDSTPYPQLTQVEEIADYSVFTPGDRIPYIIFYPLDTKWGGSRDDITGKGVWKDGRWTVEFKRRLDTRHPADDIIFSPAKTRFYVFDAAVFDHSVAVHSNTGPISLEIK